MLKFFLCSTSLLCLLALSAPALATQPAQTTEAGRSAMADSPIPFRYRIDMTNPNRRVVTVQAEVRLKGGELLMAPWGFAQQLPNGWATFVDNLQVESNGKNMPLQLAAPGKWKVDAPDGTKLSLRYTVRLHHDQHDWKTGGGIDARPALLPDSVIWITKALLIFSDDDEAAVSVQFAVPNGWKVATPWKAAEGSDNLWLPANLYEAYDNAVVAGHFEMANIGEGPMKIVLAMDPALKQHMPLFRDALALDLTEYQRIFGALPNAHYLISLRKDEVDDGEAFGNSFVQVFKRTDFAESRMVWAKLFAHEMFHYWNGIRLDSTDIKSIEWFKEGITEYVAARTLVRAKVIDEQQWLQMVGFNLSRFYSARYMVRGDKPSLQSAGSNKGANWRLIYGGGASIGLMLDIELRAATGNLKSLDTVLRLMEDRFGKTMKRYTPMDLQAVFSEVAGVDMAPFFKLYVEGTERFPPVDTILRNGGWHVNHVVDEFYIQPAANATTEALAIRHGILGQ